MGKFWGAVGTAAWTAAMAAVLTAVTGAIWTALLLTNLKLSPAVPWSAAAMAAIGWAIWTYLAGAWGPRQSRSARRTYLRAGPVSARLFAVAVTAGVLCLTGLAGLWIVLFQLVKVPGNSADFSHLPPLTVAAALLTAALVGAVFEEGGFRGYFQGTLERHLPGPVAIAICALAMAPEHALTQGFVWPTMVFYLLVDVMLGTSAYLTKSVLPGIAVHAIGLLVFFGIVWPGDKTRMPIWQHGADAWFWLHAGQAVLFGVAGILVFIRLARMAKGGSVAAALPRIGGPRAALTQ
ncbi:MAG TPA: type II CAAX endopeptidase family protein [Rhizomicrobium sp.]|jgi:membrane protease YdiL (CAAX protease family)|nr:type II CAAX endopeptidase family protein [Rhizomicrobium sp.]